MSDAKERSRAVAALGERAPCDVCQQPVEPRTSRHLLLAFDDRKGEFTEDSYELVCCEQCAPRVGAIVDRALEALWALRAPDPDPSSEPTSP